FRERLQSTNHHHHADYALCAHCEAALVSAVQFYTEDFLSGFNLPDCPQFDEWQFFETETLRQLMGEALQKLVFCYTGRQAYEQAIPLARRSLELDVLHEAPHRALMLLYGRTGQWAAALRQYEHCQQVLEEELGAEPDDETQALYEAIVARRLPDTPTRTLSVEGRLPAFRHNLRPATD